MLGGYQSDHAQRHNPERPGTSWGKETLAAINQNTDLNLPEVDAMLLAETDGYTQEETDYQIAEGNSEL